MLLLRSRFAVPIVDCNEGELFRTGFGLRPKTIEANWAGAGAGGSPFALPTSSTTLVGCNNNTPVSGSLHTRIAAFSSGKSCLLRDAMHFYPPPGSRFGAHPTLSAEQPGPYAV